MQKWCKIPHSFSQFCRVTRKFWHKHPSQSNFFDTKNVRLLSVCLSVHCPSVAKIGQKTPSLQTTFKSIKTRSDPCHRPRFHRHPKHAKSPQNRPFTAIPRAKYNLSNTQLNFCYKKRALRPPKIKPKYNFWYILI